MGSIIKVNEYKDFNNNAIMTSDGAGNVTVNAAGLKATPAFSAYQSGNQTIDNTTNTILTFATEVFDTDNAYDGTNKFTVPSGEDGKYVFIANIRMDSMYNEDEIQLAFFKNGSQDSTSATFWRVAKDNVSPAFGITGLMELAAADYIQVNTYHNRGSSRTTSAAYTAFSGYKLIGA